MEENAVPRKPRRFLCLAAIVTLVAAGCSRPPSSSTAQETVTATIGQSGGHLANRAGVALDVPKDVLRAPAKASITPQEGGAWDVHIDTVWSGHVSVSLPTGENEQLALFAHQVGGEWQVEEAAASGGAITAQMSSLSWVKVLKCLSPSRQKIIKCMLDAGIKTLALKNVIGDPAKKLLKDLFDVCSDLVDGVIDFVKQAAWGIAPPPQCSAVDGSPPAITGPQPTSGPQPDSNPTVQQPPAPTSKLTVSLTENPFRCDGGQRTVGYVADARPGEKVAFSSSELGSLSTGTAGQDGHVPLTWLCQPSDAGTVWHVIGRGTSGATISFTVTGGAGPHGGPIYYHSVYHTCANGKCGLKLHNGPGYSNYTTTRTLDDGNTVGIVCQGRGESVSGVDGSSSNVWDRLVEGDWAADFYINTPGTTGSFSPPIPLC